ncbi:VOC family protein [Actinomycetospora soli]|uniref:VOC family protein n=1 Tax=Actinomycetospora soli TaxID=2893887 RepID=UPI001E5F8E7E|nr:VOC family protein [Actinomycetospora soli]MCD2188308.1 VOC family protein [Actinomycetospora soli]
MSPSTLLAVTIDAVDPVALADFWARALGVAVGERSTDAHGTTYVTVPVAGGTDLLLQQVADPTPGKTRIHLDLQTDGSTREAEIARLTDLGARVVDPAPDHPWVVLADPEGNAFCVLGRHGDQDGDRDREPA